MNSLKEIQTKDNVLKQVYTGRYRIFGMILNITDYDWSIWHSIEVRDGAMKKKWESVNGKFQKL